MDDQILQLLLKRFQDRIDGIKDTLARGNVSDIEEYRLLVGTVRGLAYAQGEIDDLLRRLKEADNDD